MDLMCFTAPVLELVESYGRQFFNSEPDMMGNVEQVRATGRYVTANDEISAYNWKVRQDDHGGMSPTQFAASHSIGVLSNKF